MHELDRLREAQKVVNALIAEEQAKMEERDKALRELKESEGIVKGK